MAAAQPQERRERFGSVGLASAAGGGRGLVVPFGRERGAVARLRGNGIGGADGGREGAVEGGAERADVVGAAVPREHGRCVRSADERSRADAEHAREELPRAQRDEHGGERSVDGERRALSREARARVGGGALRGVVVAVRRGHANATFSPMLRRMANEKPLRPLDGRVALVVDGGGPVGRAVALALAARGVRIVVAGRDERALGETVGEIAFGGGKARHVAGEPTADLGRVAAARARDVFGGLDVLVACPGAPSIADGVAAPRVVQVEDGDPDARAARAVAEVLAALS